MRANPPALVDLLQRHRFALLWMGCLATIATAWARVYLFGAVPYFLTDILINYADGMVRRGLTGQIAVFLSTFIGGRPILWALLMVSGVTVALFHFAIRLFRAAPDDRAWLPFLLGPTGLLFLAYDPNGSMRKEVFAYLSLALLLQSSIAANERSARLWALAGTSGFLLTLMIHEAMILILPGFFMGCWLMQRRWPALRGFAVALAVFSALAALALVAVMVSLPIPDPRVICAAAGLEPCLGAIGWLEQDLSQAVAYVFGRRDWIDLPIFAGYASLCLLPFLNLRWTDRSRLWHIIVLAAPLIAVAPLFVIGFDWGRWLHMAFFPLCLICLTAARLGEVAWRVPISPLLLVVYVGSWSMPHALATLNYTALAIWPALGFVCMLQAWWRKGGEMWD